ncbi:glycosyltransferase [Aeromonas schubertii]|uniref:glycosyltransferase n=1 Tax=Aeromonas schubertii TaxID=652 RepID=UPI0010A8F08E|nr:glycosyltransferase [Aeromonas schubertii]QCG49759.1 glycosyltransferase [Aeromonas schubertii]
MTKKVLFFIHSLGMGGAEKVLLSYVKSLVGTYGYNITVATNGDSKECVIGKEISRIATVVNLGEGIVKNGFLSKAKCSIIKKTRIKKLVEQHEVIIDFLDGDFYKYLGRCKKPKIMWLHSSFHNLEKRKRHMHKRCASYDRVVLICQDMMDEVTNLSWAKKARVIYNPFDFVGLTEQSKLAEGVSSEEALLLGRTYILSVSRLDEQTKDIERLLVAYADAVNDGLEKELVIIGDGPDSSYLRERASRLSINDRIHFLGMKSNPYVWMRHADTFVLSSKGEGFGLVLVEALHLCGKVISTDCPVGPSEILERGKLGLLTPMSDTLALKNALLYPLLTPSGIDLKKYSYASVMRDFDSMLQELL